MPNREGTVVGSGRELPIGASWYSGCMHGGSLVHWRYVCWGLKKIRKGPQSTHREKVTILWLYRVLIIKQRLPSCRKLLTKMLWSGCVSPQCLNFRHCAKRGYDQGIGKLPGALVHSYSTKYLDNEDCMKYLACAF